MIKRIYSKLSTFFKNTTWDLKINENKLILHNLEKTTDTVSIPPTILKLSLNILFETLQRFFNEALITENFTDDFLLVT